MPFLEDARGRGALRTMRAVYQFRHATLQDNLAGHTTASPPTFSVRSAVRPGATEPGPKGRAQCHGSAGGQVHYVTGAAADGVLERSKASPEPKMEADDRCISADHAGGKREL
jgi:hypothetical protein